MLVNIIEYDSTIKENYVLETEKIKTIKDMIFLLKKNLVFLYEENNFEFENLINFYGLHPFILTDSVKYLILIAKIGWIIDIIKYNAECSIATFTISSYIIKFGRKNRQFIKILDTRYNVIYDGCTIGNLFPFKKLTLTIFKNIINIKNDSFKYQNIHKNIVDLDNTLEYNNENVNIKNIRKNFLKSMNTKYIEFLDNKKSITSKNLIY